MSGKRPRVRPASTASKEPITNINIKHGGRQRKERDVERHQSESSSASLVTPSNIPRTGGEPSRSNRSKSWNTSSSKRRDIGAEKQCVRYRKGGSSGTQAKRNLQTAAAGSIQESYGSQGSGKKRKQQAVNERTNDHVSSQKSVQSVVPALPQPSEPHGENTVSMQLVELLRDQKKTLSTLNDRITKLEEQNKQVLSQLGSEREKESRKTKDDENNTSRTSTKEKYEKIMGGRLTMLPDIFSHTIIGRSITKVLCMKIITVAKDSLFGLENLRDILRMMLFSLNGNGMKKNIQDEVHGRELSKLKRTIILDCFQKALVNQYGLFADGEEDDDSTRPRRPFWLQKNPVTKQYYISEKQLASGFDRREKCSTSNDMAAKRRINIATHKTVPCSIDDAEYIGYHTYGLLTNHIYVSRRLIVSSLFESVMYLFYDWIIVQRTSKIIDRTYEHMRLSSLRLKWYDAPVSVPIPLNTIPLTKRTAAAANENYEEYLKFLKQRTDVQLIVEHDVLVTGGKGRSTMRKRKGTLAKKWRRVVSLMDAAAVLLQSFSGHAKNYAIQDMLIESEYSIIVVYLLSLSLRELIEKQNAVEVEFAHNDNRERRPPTETEAKYVSEILELLLPNSQAKEKGLASNVYSVPPSVYNTFNISEQVNNVQGDDRIRNEMEGEEVNELDELSNAAAFVLGNNGNRSNEEAEALECLAGLANNIPMIPLPEIEKDVVNNTDGHETAAAECNTVENSRSSILHDVNDEEVEYEEYEDDNAQETDELTPTAAADE